MMGKIISLGIGRYLISALVVYLVGLSAYVYVLKGEIRLKEANHRVLEVQYKALIDAIEVNKVEYESNLKFAEKEQKKMRNGHEKKVAELEKWRADNEKIDCDDGMEVINSYVF